MTSGTFFGRVRRSYGAKLALASIAIVALLVVFGTMVHAETSDRLRDDVREELTTTAEARAQSLDTWVKGVETQARLTSRHPVLTSDDPDRIRPFLQDVVEGDAAPSDVVAVHYYDTENRRFVTSSSDRMIDVDAAEQGVPFAAEPPRFDDPDDTYVSDPFRVPVADGPVVAVLSPVPGHEDRAVVYLIDLERRVQSLVETVDGGSTVVVNDQGRIAAHTNPDRITTTFDRPVTDELDEGTTFSSRDGTLTASAPMDTGDWVVLVTVPTDEAYALGDHVASSILGLILLGVISLALLGVTVGSNTIISLRTLTDKAETMAAGDLDVDMETRRRDEFGRLFAAFAEMRDSLHRRIEEAQAAREAAEAARQEAEERREEAEAARETAEKRRKEAETAREEAEAQRTEAEQTREDAQELARHLERTASEYEAVMRAVTDGDLTRRVDPDTRNDAMNEIGEAFNAMVDEIERTVATAKQFAEHVSEAAARADADVDRMQEMSADVSDALDGISGDANRQTDHLQTVSGEIGDLSASVEEVAATVDDLAETSTQAAEAGESGRDAAEAALEQMDAVEAETERTVEEIEALDEAMNEIGEIVEVISDVAEQTNLLALNAAIEAAHTGEEGDGFAVVADEVKSLAEETREQAEEIEERIERINEQTVEAVTGMRETTDRVTDGVETVEGAIDSLERIVAYVEEIDDHVQQISDTTDQQAQSATRVVDQVDEVADISQRTAAEADDVAEAADRQVDTLAEVSDSAGDLAARAERLQSALSQFSVSDRAVESPSNASPAYAND